MRVNAIVFIGYHLTLYFLRIVNRCQLNAYPAKPAANVDLFTSHIHGEAGVTVMVAIKTCQTRNAAEVPIVHIELCMAPPRVV